MTSHATVVLLDYGSQYTQLITRRVRELGVYALVLPAHTSVSKIESYNPRALILSGGPSSVYEAGAPPLPQGFLELQARLKFPVLGICYGMQLLVQTLGGEVKRATHREYGRMAVKGVLDSQLFSGLKPNFQAWMSHGDETLAPPVGFKCSAQSETGSMAAIENPQALLYGLQFHPEVTHTEGGVELLKQFLFKIVHLIPDWTMGSVMKEEIEKIKIQVGDSAHVICALSGGVDSAVAAALVHQALGKRLHCVFVNNGLLRFQEQARVMVTFEKMLHLPVRLVEASSLFLDRLKGVEDPEKKRKIIGALFISVFETGANTIAQKTGHRALFTLMLLNQEAEVTPRSLSLITMWGDCLKI
jgi:GMP synthase (glutamine-hydrolysing)